MTDLRRPITDCVGSLRHKMCRCGHNGEGDHPCHYGVYTCGKPSTQRFYNAKAVALSGMQMKFQVSDTWACDQHWEEYLKVYGEKK